MREWKEGRQIPVPVMNGPQNGPAREPTLRRVIAFWGPVVANK